MGSSEEGAAGGSKVYLAGPDVFHPEATQIGAKKKAICAAQGLTGLYPLDNAFGEEAGGAALAARIFAANMAMIDQADGVVANVTPETGRIVTGPTPLAFDDLSRFEEAVAALKTRFTASA